MALATTELDTWNSAMWGTVPCHQSRPVTLSTSTEQLQWENLTCPAEYTPFFPYILPLAVFFYIFSLSLSLSLWLYILPHLPLHTFLPLPSSLSLSSSLPCPTLLPFYSFSSFISSLKTCPPPAPKSVRVGEIGWGVPGLSDASLLKSGNQIIVSCSSVSIMKGKWLCILYWSKDLNSVWDIVYIILHACLW